jgi:hypothetical protein
MSAAIWAASSNGPGLPITRPWSWPLSSSAKTFVVIELDQTLDR